MKIALLSDVHMEFGSWIPNEFPDVDVFVLAGDIAVGTRNHDHVVDGLRDLTDTPVLSVYGNHEYYGHEFIPGTQCGHVLGDYVFVTSTLWSYPEPENVSMINDFELIRGMTVDVMRNEHLALRAGIAETIDTAVSVGFKVVCVTHHLPSLSCISDGYKNSPLNPCFASPTLEKIWKPEWEGHLVAWCYGHTHDSADFVERHTGVRMVCNPHGYTPGPAKWKVIEV